MSIRKRCSLSSAGAEAVFRHWIAKRYKDWGAGEFSQRSGTASKAFFKYVTDNALIELAERSGLEAARQVLVEMIEGRTDPAVGHVIVL